MSRVEQRKAGFKSKPGSSGERTRKNEQLRKEKRSTMILAKRLKGASLGQEEQEQFSDAYLAEALQKIVGDVGARYEGLRMVRRLLCSAQPRISQLIGAGVVPLAAQMLVCPNEDLRLEAAWCLTNIATGNHEETGEVLAAAPQMLQLLLGGAGVTVALQEQVCWALGNIAGDCDEYRQVLLAHSCLPAVTHFLETATALPCTPAPASQGLSSPSPSSSSCTTTTPAQTAAWALSNLARGAVPGAAFVDLDKAPLLLRLLACGMGGGGGAGEGVGGGVGGVLAGGPDCVAVEVWWLFAFLSAKEDAAVEHYLQRGLLGAVAMALQSAVAQ
ncbi:armadillo-type protein, partial [Ochromonadaceae sp. CCMP2298]